MSASISTRSLSRVWRLRWWRVTSCLRIQIQVREGVGQKADQILDISSISSTSSTLHTPHSLSGCRLLLTCMDMTVYICNKAKFSHAAPKRPPGCKNLVICEVVWQRTAGLRVGMRSAFFPFHTIWGSKQQTCSIHQTYNPDIGISVLQFKLFKFLHRSHKWGTLKVDHI